MCQWAVAVGVTHLWQWGGWGSNPRPTDYESSPPAALVRAVDLPRRGLAFRCSGRFRHVLGMIKPHAGLNRRLTSLPRSSPCRSLG
jgi:hypothetical protein